MTGMTRMPTYGKIDLENVYFGDSVFAHPKTNIGSEVAKALENMISEEPLSAMLPFRWAHLGIDGLGGPAVDDPLTIYIGLNFLSPNMDGPVFKTDLKSLIDKELNDTDYDLLDNMQAVSNRLRELADYTDSLIEERSRPGY